MQRIPHLVINNLSNPKQKKFKLQSYLATAPIFSIFQNFKHGKILLRVGKIVFLLRTPEAKDVVNQMWSTSIATVKEITSLTEKEKGVYCLKTTPVKENVIA